MASSMPGSEVATAVFLHTQWRSRGTWLWAALRRDPKALGFYEPLHEMLAELTPAMIAAHRPEAWDSGHPAMEPYWREFAPLLRPEQPGVPGFSPEFTTDAVFVPAEAPQPALAAYLRRLLEYATGQGKAAVFKFCRSLGRVGWMQAQFPQALHLVLLRSPWAAWLSARRQLEEHGNAFFLSSPLLLLVRNCEAPPVARVCEALRVPLPRLRRREAATAREACATAVGALSWAERYRVFLAFWLAATLAALGADSLFVDADLLAGSARYRHGISAQITAASGLVPNFAATGARPPGSLPPLEAEQAAMQRTALALLEERCGDAQPQGYVLAWRQLAQGLLTPPNPLGAAVAEYDSLLRRPRFWRRWGRAGGAIVS